MTCLFMLIFLSLKLPLLGSSPTYRAPLLLEESFTGQTTVFKEKLFFRISAIKCKYLRN